MKLRLPLLALTLGLLPLAVQPTVEAETPCNAPDLVSFAYEQIPVSNASIGFTAATYAPPGQRAADMAVVTVETNAVRYRDDGVAPTSTVGQKVSVSGGATVCGANQIAKIRWFRAAAADGQIDVSYYRRAQ